jgi:hypothetical protein
MRDPDEPGTDGELPLPPRPAAEVLVPRLRAEEQLRRELRRLEAERESGLQELGGLVVDMARNGALSPAKLADRAAALRSRQDQIDAITGELGSRSQTAMATTGSRRAALLAALLAAAILGAVAGAWIERRHDGARPAPLAAPSVVTETVTMTAPVPPAAAPVVRPVTTRVPPARGGRAVARRR